MVDLIEKTSIDILEKKKVALARGGEDAMKELTAGGKDIISVLCENSAFRSTEISISKSSF